MWFSLYLVHVPLFFFFFFVSVFESLHCHEFSSGVHMLRPDVHLSYQTWGGCKDVQ